MERSCAQWSTVAVYCSGLNRLLCSRMILPPLPHYEIRYSGNGLKASVFSGLIHQQVNFHSPRRAMIGREGTNSDGGVQVAGPVTNPSQGANILSIYVLDLIEQCLQVEQTFKLLVQPITFLKISYFCI